MTVINKRMPPFALIEVAAQKRQPTRVLVNGAVRAEFQTLVEANLFADSLNAKRKATERELKRADSAKYWRLRCEATELMVGELEAKLEAKVPSELMTFFKRWKMVIQNRKNARRSRPKARASDSDEITSEFRRLVREGHTEREARGIMNSWGRWAKSTIYRKTKKSVL